MLILWGVGLGTEIRDVYILGGVVLCGGLGTDIGDVNGGGGAATGEFWDRYWGCCMLIVNTVGGRGGARGRNLDVNISGR